MMDDKTYIKLKALWKGHVYQVWPNLKVETISAHIDVFKNMDVVDIGCNAGILTYNLAQYANSYLGVERDKVAYKQALVTQKFISTPGQFYNLSISDFISKVPGGYNAAFASSVLYYFSESALALMKKIMLPKCKVVLFVSRENKPKYVKKTWLQKHNNLYHWRNIVAFLESAKMHVEVRDEITNWVSVIGRQA